SGRTATRSSRHQGLSRSIDTAHAVDRDLFDQEFLGEGSLRLVLILVRCGFWCEYGTFWHGSSLLWHRVPHTLRAFGAIVQGWRIPGGAGSPRARSLSRLRSTCSSGRGSRRPRSTTSPSLPASAAAHFSAISVL